MLAIWGWTTLPCFQTNPTFLFVYQGLPLPLLILSLVLVAFHWRSVPLVGWLWLLSGAVTAFWSLSLGFTLLSIQWDAVLLAALVAGRLLWKMPLLPLGLIAAMSGWASLNLISLGSRFYLSGSVMYVAAGLAVPALCLTLWLWWQQRGLWRWLAALGSVALLYLIGASASRAAYLPTLVILGLSAWRLWRGGATWRQLLLAGVLLFGGVAVFDTLCFDHAVLQAVGLKALDSLHRATSDGGNLQTRLQMWEVALHAFRTHPLGLGSGAYGDVFQSTQAWPVYYSRFVHNTFLETLASGGLPRLLLLCALLWSAFITAWRGERWPVALALVAIWLNMCFDVTGNIPSTVMLSFLCIGLSLGHSDRQPFSARVAALPPLFAGLSALVVVGVALAWWWPQPATQQAYWRGSWPIGTIKLPAQERQAVLTAGVARYPASITLRRQWIAGAPTLALREQRLREATQIFPFGDASFFAQLAQVERQLGVSAAQTERTCLSHFGRKRSPLGLTLSVGGISGASVTEICSG